MRPRQITDEQILDAARLCFLEHGPAVSTQVIADALGVTSAALFKRFGTKEDLMVAALAPVGRPPFVDLLDAGPDERPVKSQLIEIADAISLHLSRMVPCIAVLRSSGLAPQDLMARYDRPPPLLVHEALANWFSRARATELLGPTVEPRSAALAFLGSLHVRSFLGHVVGKPFEQAIPGDYVATMVDMFVDGLRVRQGEA